MFVAETAGYDQILHNLRLYHRALVNPDLDEETRRRVRQELMMLTSTTQQPKYTCPTCREIIAMKPTRNLSLREVIDHMTEFLGEKNPAYLNDGRAEEQWHHFLLQ